MSDNRNLILAFALSAAILLGFQFFYEKPPQQEHGTAPITAEQKESAVGTQTANITPSTSVAPALPDGPQVPIKTDRLHGSLNTVGARLDDLTLADYRQTTEPNSPEIRLLTGQKDTLPYYVEFGWTGADAALRLPDRTTLWSFSGEALTPSTPVTFSWNNGAGLIFKREISIDEHYMFTIKQTVRNETSQPVSLAPYGQIVRHGMPKTQNFLILHEGPLGVLNKNLEEYSYKKLAEDNQPILEKTIGGWLGITDKYWLVSLIPDQKVPVSTRVQHIGDVETGRFLVSATTENQALSPGEEITSTMRLFAGAKQVRLVSDYAQNLQIDRFDLAIDFGWFYFLTKPFFYILDYLGRWLGNFGVAIIAFTVLVRLALFPLANKSFVSMSKMKKLQPQMTAIREKYAGDTARMSQEIMSLYKREKVNPMGGCLPMLLQIPVFFALYKVLFVALEMRHAPFYGWIQDLSAPDPTTIFNLFGLVPWDPPSMLMIGVWPLLMGLSMFIQQKLSPTTGDPIQAKMFMFMPILMVYLMASFPAGLLIYWTWNNILSIAQQWFIMRRMGVS